MAATIAHIDTENINPKENIPQQPATIALKPVALKPAEEAVPVAEPVEEVEEAEEAEDLEEDEEDAEYEDEEDEDEDIDAEDEGEEIYPEDELSLEVDAPFATDVEAKEAAELAKTLGFETDSALSHLGQQEKRVALTITKYAELISNSEKEVAQLYDGLTTEINNLRTSVDDGIRAITADAQIKMTHGAVEVIRTLMEHYLRTVLERSVVHAEYREASQVVVSDVLNVLNILGRPLYWKGPTEEVASEVAEADAEAMEEDAMEEEEAFDDDEEEDFSEEEDEEVDMGEEAEEENTSLNVAAFRRLVDVTNRWDTELSPESYACLQATTEDFLVSLIQASGRSSHFAGRREVTEEDVRFAQLMTQQKW